MIVENRDVEVNVRCYEDMGGGGRNTSLSDHTECAPISGRFGTKFLEWDVIFREKFWNAGIMFGRNSGNGKGWDGKQFSYCCFSAI